MFFAERELAGDLAISLETAGRQARAYGHSLEDEVKVLLLHGCCIWRGWTMRRMGGIWPSAKQSCARSWGLMKG